MKKLTKLVSGFVVFAMALSFVVTPVTASAATAAELQAQITSLMATINALQSQLNTTSGTTVSTSGTGYTFNTNLTVGSKGTDVLNLQKVLNMSSDTTVALTGAGSAGMETSYFGPATKAAVMKFQTKYGISPVAGYVGSITRAKLNTMGGTTTTTTTTTTTSTYPAGCTSTVGYSVTTGQACSTGGVTTLPTGGNLTVTAGTQPTNSLAPESAARIPFTTVVLTAGSADVTVNSITVERSGLAQDAVFAGIVLLDQNGLQIGIAKTLNSNHQAMVGEPFVIKAGTSMTVTVAGNMAAALDTYAGQVAGLNVVAVNTSATVAGSMPIMGAQQTINGTLTIGTAAMSASSFDPGSSQTKEIGTTGYKFAGVRVTAGSAEQTRLWSVRWNQSGSASSNDLANVMVYVDGTAYPTTVSSDGKYYSALFAGGLLIDKGNSKDIYIQGDIVGTGSAGRTVKFDIYKATDIYVSGVTYGYGITATQSQSGTAADATSEFTAGTPFFDGSKVTVSAGSVTAIQKSNSVAAQNVAVNVPNQVLGGYDVDLKGEPITVQSSIFHIATSSVATWPAGTTYITSVTIVDQNGAVVAGPVDAVADGVGQKVTFTDSITYPIGKHTYTLKGKIPTLTSNGTVITLSTTPLTTDWSNIIGQTTGNTITLPAGTVTMNPVTVKAAALAISMSSTPAAQFIVAGGQGIVFANLQIDASQSGEDVRFNSLAFTKTFSATTYTYLNSCQLFDGVTALNTGSNVHNPSVATTETITLDQSLTVAKGTVKTLALKCNVSSSATGTFTWTFTPSSTNPTATGVTSGGSVTATGAAGTSKTMTISSGSVTTSTAPGAASYVLAASGSTGIEAGKIRFHATNEAVNLNRIGLVLTNTASSSATDLVQVSLWDGATQIGTATFLGTATSATSTLSTALVIPKDGDKDITIKVDLARVGVGEAGTSGALIAVDSNATVDSTGTQGTGVSSGAQLNATGSSSSSGVRLFRSYPTISLGSGLSANGVTDGKLMRFAVTANTNGGISINQFKFTLSTTSVTVSAVNLFGYSESTYSSGISGFVSGQIAASTYAPTSAGAVTITPSSIINIPAGTTYYFELRGTVTGTGTAYSVNTTLLGDSVHTTGFVPSYTAGGTGLMATSSSYVLSVNNLVWSPNSTTTGSAVNTDWSNGFGVLGLPSSGLSFNRAQ